VSEGVRGYAVDAKTAEALWKKSEEVGGRVFLAFFTANNDQFQEEQNDGRD
jgi:hypothetical protein